MKTVKIEGFEFQVAENKEKVFEDIFGEDLTIWEVPKSYTTSDLTKLMTLGLAHIISTTAPTNIN